MARGDIFPPRTALPGTAVNWARHAEGRVEGVEMGLTTLEQSVQGLNRSTASSLSDIGSQLQRLSEQQEVISQIPVAFSATRVFETPTPALVSGWNYSPSMEWFPPNTGQFATMFNLTISAYNSLRDFSPTRTGAFHSLVLVRYTPPTGAVEPWLPSWLAFAPNAAGSVALAGAASNSDFRVASFTWGTPTKDDNGNPVLPALEPGGSLRFTLATYTTTPEAFNSGTYDGNVSSLSISGSYLTFDDPNSN